ncbi:MAG: hypothetical protein ACF8Q5_06785 [Phycisphaerales bacterium JB040]
MPSQSVLESSANNAEATARRMFCAVLERWACDCLELRARGYDVPGVRLGDGHGPRRATRVRAVGTGPGTQRVTPRWAG